MKALALAGAVVLAVSVAGCSSMQGIATKYAEHVCSLPPYDRALLRGAVDNATYPHRVRVECAGTPEWEDLEK